MGLMQPVLASAVTVDTESLHLRFSEYGDLLNAEVCFPDCRAMQSKTRNQSSEQLRFTISRIDRRPIHLRQSHENGLTVLVFTDQAGEIVRRWQIPDQGWSVSVTVLGAERATLSSGAGFRPPASSGFGYLLEQSRYLLFDGADVDTVGLDESSSPIRTSAGWLGFRNRFLAALVLPGKPLEYRLQSGESVDDASIMIQLDTSKEHSLSLYLGPVEPVALSQASAELESLMYSGLWFWLRWICQGLYYLLNTIFLFIPQWGLAVMILSVLVGVLMRPLSRIAERLQDQVHETDARLSPSLTAIKRDFKGAEQSEKILALYKSEGVHPLYSLKSLLGVFVVIPVFIGAFDMLAENIHLSGVSFLWIADLSHADAFAKLPFGINIPFFGSYLNLLPFIMTGFSFLASKLHSHPAMDAAQQRKQSRNLALMSIGFLVLFYTFPAGMVLYWTTNNLISVIKMLWKKRRPGDNQSP